MIFLLNKNFQNLMKTLKKLQCVQIFPANLVIFDLILFSRLSKSDNLHQTISIEHLNPTTSSTVSTPPQLITAGNTIVPPPLKKCVPKRQLVKPAGGPPFTFVLNNPTNIISNPSTNSNTNATNSNTLLLSYSFSLK